MLSFFSAASYAQETTLWLDQLPVKNYSEGIPSVVTNTNSNGDTMRMAGKKYLRGVGAQSISVLAFYIDGHAKSFEAVAGVDDKANPNVPLEFFVLGDGKVLFSSGAMHPGDIPKEVHVDLQGIKRLGLLVYDNEPTHTRSYANWADARFIMSDNAVPGKTPNDGDRYILTPSPVAAPAIHSPKVFGARPGNPVLYSIAVTGQRPIRFSADHLPEGLELDQATGIITGRIKTKGDYTILLHAVNKAGSSAQPLLLRIGDTIALTPPMGWNGWNSWAREIDREKVLASAEAMMKMGLKDHGWTYINIDDAWQGQRGGPYNAIQPNEKFPRFSEMISQIHSMGLKLGVYSTPWIASYAGFTGGSSDRPDAKFTDSIRDNKRAFRYIGKYRFEKEDALQMAAWGVDYLKYDWRLEVPSAERMSQALKKSGRDIVYSLSNSAPFASAKDWARVANLYRTGPDIRDSWTSLYYSAFTIDKWAPFAGPGHWSDPDMLIVGNVTTGSPLHPTRLTPDEQYSHVSIFSLLAAPLLIGCPIEQLDAFTLNLLTNDEVIAIDQDPLGKPARLVAEEDGVQIWSRLLSDGSYAVGLFNTDHFGKTPQSFFRWANEPAKTFTFRFASLPGNKWKVRDVWRQKDLGDFTGSITTRIPHHGVMLFRLIKK